VDDFVIARNPDGDSSLPYLVRVPVPGSPVVLKVRDTWPRTSKIYCHASTDWPNDPDIIERLPVRSCRRRGAAIDLTLERARENRSQFVFTKARGRQMIFWQSARTNKQAKPNVGTPTARAKGRQLDIIVDSNERYAWNFAKQQAVLTKQRLPVGDYAVAHKEHLVGVVERKSLADLVATLTGGKLWYLLADLATHDRAAIVVEDRYSQVFKLDRVRPLTVSEGLAEAAARYPQVPILFCETRQLAMEWSYRFLGASLELYLTNQAGLEQFKELPRARALPPAEPTTKHVRAWARSQDIDVPTGGRLRPEIWELYRQGNLPA
jgi:hypothetical protein